MKKLIIVAASVVLAGAVLADSVGNGWEYHGYARSGTWQNINGGVPAVGGPDSAFYGNVNGFPSGIPTGRIGNTASTYGEVELVKDFQAQNGVWSKWHMLAAYTTNNLNGWGNADNNGSNGNLYIREAYAEMGGFAWNPNATIWAGQRYYDRNNIWVTDNYVTNYSGTGFGIQGLENGNLNLAYMTTTDGQSSYYTNGGTTTNNPQGTPLVGTTSTAIVDYTLGQFGLNASLGYNNSQIAQRAVIANVNNSNVYANASAATWGGQFGVSYNQPTWYGLMNGFSQTTFQYGQGFSTGWTLGTAHANTNASPLDRNYQLTTTGVASFGNWQVQNVVGLNRQTPKYSTNSTTFNFVVAPMYSFSQNFSLMGEVGYLYGWQQSYTQLAAGGEFTPGPLGTWTNVNGGMVQLSIAPTFTLSSDFFARPQIRPFVTYLAGSQNQIMLNGANHATLYGVQAEVWF